MMVAAMTLAALVQTTDKSRVFYDGHYYVYDETKSCALYADFADGSMMRLSFNARDQKSYFTDYSPKWDRMAVGTTFTILIGTDDDPKNNLGGVASVVSNGKLKGINTDSGAELLDFLQGARYITLFGPNMMQIDRLGTPAMDKALKALKTCSMEKLNRRP